MIANKTVLAIIPARGGSKGVPRKNIYEVAGKPLIAWTIESARKSKYIDRLILSSDDAEIIAVAREWGCDVPFVRPAKLSQDDTPGIEPVIHAINALPGYDYVVLLQPTSPLRTVENIDKAIEMCLDKHAAACVSVTEPDKSPFWMFTVNADGKMRKLLESGTSFARRQDLPPVYALNGAVYVADTRTIVETRSFVTETTVPYIMSKNNSVDIDTEEDMVVAEVFLNRANRI
ncbi:N-acetylneuraminate cytidylyltransferase [Desulfuromonas sp. DDH964]|uniref:acylneuraminate cytidylyltransferase family protein n=1 Tax=Desulfuromonas sp. DDH964 TaxID=1823759 RepID=UPI00078D0149|nr:acylneuraminate cytidylyltransferase family protein [Desulfuromonas sp. DDH964]AMV71857.1 N-acetylneuraminate cytidylyltransferase [Desulfuromonas sp. DDH964]